MRATAPLVLIVEDHVGLAHVIVKRLGLGLRPVAIRTVVAASLAEARAAVKREVPIVALVDVRLGELGLETA